MSMSIEDREKIAKAFQSAMPAVAQLVHVYTTEASAPERFFLGVYDAADGGANWLAGGEPEARAIAEHEIRVAEWDNDHAAIGRKKVRAALRTGCSTGDVARAGESFLEDEVPYPGGCVAEVGGQSVVVSTSGLRGNEDEVFSLLLIQLLQRALTPPAA